MKTRKTSATLPLLALLLLAILSGCSDKAVKTLTANVPVYQSLESFRSQGVQMQPAQALVRPGKICFYRHYLLVNEVMKGIHFYDNSNPSAPVSMGFLPVLANADMTVDNDILYVDNYSDLLLINISDIANPVLLQRVNDVFDFTAYRLLEGYDQAYPLVAVDATQGIVTRFEVKETELEFNSYASTNWVWNSNQDFVSLIAKDGSNGNGTHRDGPGSSLALPRFAIAQDHLYALLGSRFYVFDIQANMREVREVFSNLAAAATLFTADGHLYVRSKDGMAIFSLQNPNNPSFINSDPLTLSCSQVALQGDFAYVSKRPSTHCYGQSNQLEVVDISDKANPVRVSSFEMVNPHGLGVDGHLLFLCGGSDGLKVFDKTDHSAIPQNLLGHFPDITALHVIPRNQILYMTGGEGIYQYSYADPANVTLLSLIPVQN
jgi:hypothetical protein